MVIQHIPELLLVPLSGSPLICSISKRILLRCTILHLGTALSLLVPAGMPVQYIHRLLNKRILIQQLARGRHYIPHYVLPVCIQIIRLLHQGRNNAKPQSDHQQKCPQHHHQHGPKPPHHIPLYPRHNRVEHIRQHSRYQHRQQHRLKHGKQLHHPVRTPTRQ